MLVNQILLDRNENQYGPSPACYEVLRKADLEHLSLYSREYTRGRKSELSYRLSEKMRIPEERLLLSYGSEDMLKQAVHCYLHPGKTMLLPKQSWWYYKSVAAEVYGKPVEYPLHARNGQFVYDAGEIVDLYDTYKPDVILIASPNNPTGNSIGLDALTALINHCSSSVIILDEAYTGFSGESSSHLPHLLSSHERLIVLRTFSKYYALAGLRIGYACVAQGLTHLISYSARYLGYNQLSERIAIAALDDDSYYRRISQRMNQDKLLYYEKFHSLNGFTAFLSDANFILVRYPARYKSILQQELEKNGIVLKFFEDPVLNNHVRLTLGTEEQNAYVLSCLATIAEHHIPSIPLMVKE